MKETLSSKGRAQPSLVWAGGMADKRSYPIRANKTDSLMRYLVESHGFPFIYEELVLYLKGRDGLRITISRQGLDMAWHDLQSEIDRFHHRKHRIVMDTSNLKQKLRFAMRDRPTIGTMSTTPVFCFQNNELGIQWTVRTDTFIGPLLSIEACWGSGKPSEDPQVIEEARESIEQFVEPDIVPYTERIEPKEVNYFVRTGQSLVLNSYISDFCKRNGINNPQGKKVTYREIMQSKSNDYGLAEQLFQIVTGEHLLSEVSVDLGESEFEESISIIIPFFNSEESILYTLASVAGQKGLERFRGGLEVVIIDDGSEKAASALVDRKSWEFECKVVRLEKNSGVSHARQIGLTHARGDIVIFIDSDVILSETYIVDHALRNCIIKDGVFVSFKENVSRKAVPSEFNKERISVANPDGSRDLRVFKRVTPSAIGSYAVSKSEDLNILEDTNFFKDFHGSRIFGVYDLACMVTGHNFSLRRDAAEMASPFSRKFTGWGMEDAYLGLRVVASGMFIIPVLSCGVYHLDHDPRSGSDEQKRNEYKANTKILDEIFEMPADVVFR